MKKNYSYLSMLLISLVLAFASCSESENYLNVIPKEATAVGSINIKSLGEKAGIKDKENKEAYNKLVDMMKNEMKAASFEKLQKIMENPKESGIDITEPVYIFSAPELFMGMTAKVIDKGNLNNTIEVLKNEGAINEITEENGFNFAKTNSKNFIAFNESTLIVAEYNNNVNEERMLLDASNMLNRKAEESIVSDKGFVKMQENKGDIAIYNNFESIDRQYTSMMEDMMEEAMGIKDIAKKFRLISGLSFEKGKIEVSTEFYTDDKELKDKIDEQEEYLRPLKNSLLKYFPKSTLGFISIGLDSENIFVEALMKNEEVKKNISAEDAEILKNIFESLGNEITIGVTNFEMTETPTILMYAEAENGDFLKELYKNQDNYRRVFKITELKENEYVMKQGRDNIFFGYKDGLVYVTNSESQYKNAGIKASPSVLENSYADAIKGSSIAYVIDFKAISELPIFKMIANSGNTKTASLVSILNKMDNIRLTGDKNVKFTLQLTDTKTNSLKQIIDMVKEMNGL